MKSLRTDAWGERWNQWFCSCVWFWWSSWTLVRDLRNEVRGWEPASRYLILASLWWSHWPFLTAGEGLFCLEARTRDFLGLLQATETQYFLPAVCKPDINVHAHAQIYEPDGRFIVRNGGCRGGIIAITHGVVVTSLQTRTSSDHGWKKNPHQTFEIINDTFSHKTRQK